MSLNISVLAFDDKISVSILYPFCIQTSGIYFLNMHLLLSGNSTMEPHVLTIGYSLSQLCNNRNYCICFSPLIEFIIPSLLDLIQYITFRIDPLIHMVGHFTYLYLSN